MDYIEIISLRQYRISYDKHAISSLAVICSSPYYQEVWFKLEMTSREHFCDHCQSIIKASCLQHAVNFHASIRKLSEVSLLN